MVEHVVNIIPKKIGLKIKQSKPKVKLILIKRFFGKIISIFVVVNIW
jgi:hypothetical protein